VHDGITRDFVYYTPSSWTGSESLPLLIVLHGVTQTGSGLMNITGFNDIAETNNFIVCYPDGISNAWNANMNVSLSQADDIGFIEELSVLLQTSLNTDPNRQYLCGISNGGFMTHKMACESSQCYAAIATVSASMSDTVEQNCNPAFAPNILHIHGTADPVVSYFGSPITGISVDQLMEKWRGYHTCDLTPVFSSMPNPNLLDFSYPEKYTYANCSQGSLELIKVVGGGHQWPGIPTVLGGVGNINMDFYSPQIIWDFLEGKSCSPIADLITNETTVNKKIVKIVDFLGRETKPTPNIPLIYIYEDGSRKHILEIGN
jgi:polyhydroxybutyrate depolymerase